jgi:hypothetical protein
MQPSLDASLFESESVESTAPNTAAKWAPGVALSHHRLLLDATGFDLGPDRSTHDRNVSLVLIVWHIRASWL